MLICILASTQTCLLKPLLQQCATMYGDLQLKDNQAHKQQTLLHGGAL